MRVAGDVYYIIFMPENSKIEYAKRSFMTVYSFISYMFMDIAGLLNIAKWAYFILVAEVHMNITR